MMYTILQNKGCGGAGWPPPIIFERLKLPQQIVYRRKAEFIGESESFKISGKYIDFTIL